MIDIETLVQSLATGGPLASIMAYFWYNERKERLSDKKAHADEMTTHFSEITRLIDRDNEAKKDIVVLLEVIKAQGRNR